MSLLYSNRLTGRRKRSVASTAKQLAKKHVLLERIRVGNKNRASVTADLFQAKVAIVAFGGPCSTRRRNPRVCAAHDLDCATGVVDELFLCKCNISAARLAVGLFYPPRGDMGADARTG